MSYHALCLMLALFVGACTSGAQVASPITKAASPTLVTVKLPLSEFRAALQITAEPYYPNDLSNFRSKDCGEPPHLTGLDACRNFMFEDAPNELRHFCLSVSIKALIAGETCLWSQEFLKDTAFVAVKYATLIADTTGPPTQLYVAALIARQYLDADDAFRSATRVFRLLLQIHDRQQCNQQFERARSTAQQTREFARQFLGAWEQERAAQLGQFMCGDHH